MKLCNSHWSDLVKAIKHKGLGRLISTHPEQAETRTRKWLAGTARPDDFDPLVVSTLEIYHKAAEMLGHAVTDRTHGHRCPLCEINRALQKQADAEWVDNVTDLMIVDCQTNNIAYAAH